MQAITIIDAKKAIENDNSEELLSIIKNNAVISNWSNKQRNKLLMVALKRQSRACTITLLSFSNNFVSREDWRPIMFAARTGLFDSFRLLVKHGMSFRVTEPNFLVSPLMVAARHGRFAIVSYILQHDETCMNHRDKLGRTALLLAAESGYHAIFSLLTNKMPKEEILHNLDYSAEKIENFILETMKNYSQSFDDALRYHFECFLERRLISAHRNPSEQIIFKRHSPFGRSEQNVLKNILAELFSVSSGSIRLQRLLEALFLLDESNQLILDILSILFSNPNIRVEIDVDRLLQYAYDYSVDLFAFLTEISQYNLNNIVVDYFIENEPKIFESAVLYSIDVAAYAIESNRFNQTINYAPEEAILSLARNGKIEHLSMLGERIDLNSISWGKRLVQDREEWLYDWSNPLFEAIECGNLEMIQHLVRSCPGLVFKEDENGETGLFLAVRKQNKDAVQLLLKEVDTDTFGIGYFAEKPNLFNDIGHSIVRVAVENSSEEILSLLCSNLNKKFISASSYSFGQDIVCAFNDEPDSLTPLMVASIWGYAEKADILISTGKSRIRKKSWGESEGEDDNKMTALLYAAKHGNFEIIKMIVESDITALEDVDSCYERNALLWAAESSSVFTISYLLEKCPELIDKSDSRGETIYSLAVKSMNLELIQFLSEYGDGIIHL